MCQFFLFGRNPRQVGSLDLLDHELIPCASLVHFETVLVGGHQEIRVPPSALVAEIFQRLGRPENEKSQGAWLKRCLLLKDRLLQSQEAELWEITWCVMVCHRVSHGQRRDTECLTRAVLAQTHIQLLAVKVLSDLVPLSGTRGKVEMQMLCHTRCVERIMDDLELLGQRVGMVDHVLSGVDLCDAKFDEHRTQCHNYRWINGLNAGSFIVTVAFSIHRHKKSFKHATENATPLRMDDEISPMVMSFAFCGPSGSGKTSLLKAYLWDQMSQTCLRKKQAVFIIFDLSDKSSFHKLPEFLKTANDYKIHTKLLIGNKADLRDERQVSYWEAQHLADAEGLVYFETSALQPGPLADAVTFAVLDSLERPLTSKAGETWDPMRCTLQ
eukprot:Skav235820  [mRNA]  locus=scaffold1267:410499:413296:- [translate_table: standard]